MLKFNTVDNKAELSGDVHTAVLLVLRQVKPQRQEQVVIAHLETSGKMAACMGASSLPGFYYS